MAVPSIDYLGLFYLLKLYQTRFCFPPPEETLDPFQIHCVPKPNDFSDMPEYFLQLVCFVRHACTKLKQCADSHHSFITRSRLERTSHAPPPPLPHWSSHLQRQFHQQSMLTL